jgi:ribosomal protein S18 acetylase RimI-like enzyme
MPVLLANLMARMPTMSDLEDITKLIIACDIAEYGVPDYTIEDLLSDWQSSSFNLETDSWVIVTTKGELVGFACVWDKEHEHISTFMCVHPDYRGRGIGTLLLRLAEERARQHVRCARPGARVVLTNTVSDCNEAAKALLEQEGYTSVRSFWRMLIEMDESLQQNYQRGKLKVELLLDSCGCLTTKQPFTHNGNYIARQYRTYEKELRAGRKLQEDEELLPQLAVGYS